MYQIVNGLVFLGYDALGHHEWKESRLDAIRFNTRKDAWDSCFDSITGRARVATVDRWNGHYEAYRDFEVQIYKDALNGIPGGKRWRFRFGDVAHERAYEYSPGRHGYTSFHAAMMAAKDAVDATIRKLSIPTL